MSFAPRQGNNAIYVVRIFPYPAGQELTSFCWSGSLYSMVGFQDLGQLDRVVRPDL